MMPRSWPSPPAPAHNSQVGIVSRQNDRFHSALDAVRVEFDAPIREELLETVPVIQCVADCFRCWTAAGQPRKLPLEPSAQVLYKRSTFGLTYRKPMAGILAADLRFYLVEGCNA